MVKKRRVSKKFIPGKSGEVAPVTLPFFELVQRYLLYIIIFLALIFLSTGGYFLWEYLNHKKEEKASTLFYQAYQMYQETKEKRKSLDEPLKLFQAVVKDYARTSSGKLSFFYMGNCQFALKKYDDAINSFTNFLEAVFSQSQMVLLAYDSLGYCYEAKKDFKKALEYFQKTINPPPGLGENGYLNIGRCFETLGDKKGGLEIYKKFLNEFPDSSKGDFVREKIRLLEMKR